MAGGVIPRAVPVGRVRAAMGGRYAPRRRQPRRGAAAEAQPRVRSPAHAERLRQEAFHTFFGAFGGGIVFFCLFLFCYFCLLVFSFFMLFLFFTFL